MSSRSRLLLLAGLSCAACMMHERAAAADVSSWLSAGGGYSAQRDDRSGSFESSGTMSFAIGVGSDPLRSVVVGGILRSMTHFGLGTDLGISARIASGGFARGQWGLAFDLGPAWRSFGDGEYGRWPVTAMVLAGAPWGFQLGVGGEVFKIAGGDASALGLVAVLEIDLLRLTVMRRGATDKWWPNPAPAGGKSPSASSRPLAGLLW